MRKHKSEIPQFPLLQMFSGLIGVLLVIVTISALKVVKVRLQQLKPENIAGIQKVNLSEKPQLKFFLYREGVTIAETSVTVPLDNLLEMENPVSEVIRQNRDEINDQTVEIQLILYPDSNASMFNFRQLMVELKVSHFNYLMLNKDLMNQLTRED